MSNEKNVSAWIERGKKFMYPARHDEWARCVNIRAEGAYRGLDVDNALDIIKLLDESGDFKKASAVIRSQNHSGGSYTMLMSMVLTFSKRGPAFYRYMEKDLPQETEDYIAKIERENKQYEAEEQANQPGNE